MSCRSKGGQRSTGRLLRSGGCSDPIRAKASCAGPRNLFPNMTTATLSHRMSQLHLSGQGRRPPHHEMHNQINIHQDHAGSNAVMCGHMQAQACPVSRLGYLELCCNSTHGNVVHSDTPKEVGMQDPHDTVLRIVKLGHRGKWRTVGILPPHCKP